jgi:hypothetical protein
LRCDGLRPSIRLGSERRLSASEKCTSSLARVRVRVRIRARARVRVRVRARVRVRVWAR